MRQRAWVVGFVLLFFFGCAVPQPTPEQFAKADYGAYPNNYKEIATQYISDILIDPYSAVFSDWKGPVKGWQGHRRGSVFGYMVCVNVNAKNRMGGYIGKKLHFLMVKDGRVVSHEGGDYREGTVGEDMVRQSCNF